MEWIKLNWLKLSLMKCNPMRKKRFVEWARNQRMVDQCEWMTGFSQCNSIIRNKLIMLPHGLEIKPNQIQTESLFWFS